MLKLTVLSDGCWRRLQHVLREVNEDLVELPTPQQVEVLNNLHENTNINTVPFAIHDLWSRTKSVFVQTLSCSSRSDSSTINVQRCCKSETS